MPTRLACEASDYMGWGSAPLLVFGVTGGDGVTRIVSKSLAGPFAET